MRGVLCNILIAIETYPSERVKERIEIATPFCKELLQTLKYLVRSPRPKIFNYISRVFIGKEGNVNRKQLKDYIRRTETLLNVLEKVNEGECLEVNEVEEVKSFVRSLIRQVKKAYEIEERLYFSMLGFVPRSRDRF